MLMLSSTHDGEVVNAARAIGRLLDHERMDWHMLANGVCRTRAARTNDDTNDTHYSNMHWRSAAEFCAGHPEHLNSWEKDFIDGMRRRSPSQKQLDVLENHPPAHPGRDPAPASLS
jgi:hypothetical protein